MISSRGPLRQGFFAAFNDKAFLAACVLDSCIVLSVCRVSESDYRMKSFFLREIRKDLLFRSKMSSKRSSPSSLRIRSRPTPPHALHPHPLALSSPPTVSTTVFPRHPLEWQIMIRIRNINLSIFIEPLDKYFFLLKVKWNSEAKL